ncbi:DUF7524 family protein [Halorussus marinus]|uniref:DUF7524 family protein n=1 Tax=Halorussus marinus TaxID=2505976 RepID=UPI0010932CDB|nr:hypothetical protein [Halorussus marinus]
MSENLTVHLNDDRLHDIRTATAFEATGSFAVVLNNGDAPVHVHLRLDDELSSVASIRANNHFVGADTARQVNVEVEDGPRPVDGQLKIVTGHGAETDYVSVSIVDPEESEETVAVDEALAAPAPDRDRDDDADGGLGGVDPDLGANAPLAALGLFAVAVAASTALLADSAVVLVGVGAVIASLAAAGYLLVR